MHRTATHPTDINTHQTLDYVFTSTGMRHTTRHAFVRTTKLPIDRDPRREIAQLIGEVTPARRRRGKSGRLAGARRLWSQRGETASAGWERRRHSVCCTSLYHAHMNPSIYSTLPAPSDHHVSSATSSGLPNKNNPYPCDAPGAPRVTSSGLVQLCPRSLEVQCSTAECGSLHRFEALELDRHWQWLFLFSAIVCQRGHGGRRLGRSWRL